MLMTLSNKEIQQAITYYLGSEFRVAGIKIIKGRDGNDSRIEVDCTKEFVPFEETLAEIPVPCRINDEATITAEDEDEEVVEVETVIEPDIQETDLPFDTETDVEILEEETEPGDSEDTPTEVELEQVEEKPKTVGSLFGGGNKA